MAIDPSVLDFPGVLPSRQKRSRETTAALLNAGAEMLRMRTLDEVSVEGLCAEAGVTVGSFYGRFESKDAYFSVLVGLAARDGRDTLALMTANDDLNGASLNRLCDVLVERVIDWMRRHEGVLRAALQRSETAPARWPPFKALARAMSEAAVPLFLRATGRRRSAAAVRDIGFGLQVVLGTLVNAILNDPGPVSLRDPEMVSRLSRILWLQLSATGAAREAAPGRKRAVRHRRDRGTSPHFADR
jgi:AcrR family transcriptional regulator